jgi:hypothetical protein
LLRERSFGLLAPGRHSTFARQLSLPRTFIDQNSHYRRVFIIEVISAHDPGLRT